MAKCTAVAHDLTVDRDDGRIIAAVLLREVAGTGIES